MIELYVGSAFGGWALDGRMQAWSDHADVASALARWAGEIAEAHATRWRRAPVTLWLSGALARPMICAPVAGLRGWREAEGLVAAGAPEATGLAGPCAVRLEDWPDTEPVVATAIDRSLEDALVEVSRVHRIAWRSVRPWWAVVLEEALRERPTARLVAVAEADALTLFGGAMLGSSLDAKVHRAFDHVATYAPAPDDRHATALWHRMLLSRDVLADDARYARASQVGSQIESAEVEDGRPLYWPRPAWGLGKPTP